MPGAGGNAGAQARLRPAVMVSSGLSAEGHCARGSWTSSVLRRQSLVKLGPFVYKTGRWLSFLFYDLSWCACVFFLLKILPVLQNAVKTRRQGRNSRRCMWEEAGDLTSLVFLEPDPQAEGIFIPRCQGRECASHANGPGDDSRGVLLGRQPLSPARA